MSVKVMSQVWEHSRQSGGALLMLLALADFADDGGRCWPGVKTLATKARMSERNARYVLRSLEAAGEIATIIGGGRHGTSGYVVTVEPASAGAKSAGGQKLPGGKVRQKGGKMRQERGQPIAPEPSGTIIEPPIQIATPPAPPAPVVSDTSAQVVTPTFTNTVVEAIQRTFPAVRLTQASKPKQLLAWVASIVVVLDRHSGRNAGIAVAAWDAWVASDDWHYKGNDESKWGRSLSDHLANGGKPARTNGQSVPAAVADTDRTARKLTPEESAAAMAEIMALHPGAFTVATTAQEVRNDR